MAATPDPAPSPGTPPAGPDRGRPEPARSPGEPSRPTRSRVRSRAFIAGGLLVAVALAVFVSPRASSQPDGLNKVAIDQGFADTEEEHGLGDVPTAGYAVEGVDDDGLSTGLAGLIGVAVTFGVCGGLVLVLRRAQSRGGDPAPTVGGPTPAR